ncbi:(2,3-dihydroxybenzoyl)adenylate synthase [Deinococcus aquaedulcis]|uniref:(2,3-dihydroxybenzoyl)adenylate synthase n=1 Tax=Deinococcus aquaedulcis TaxID=2840455 RepID=UPI001C840565|nr:AMP-binding protein [Deinococcus aquaedulcis]
MSPGDTADFTPWPDNLARTYREAGYWQGETFSAWLAGLAAQYGDRTALIAGQTRLSYRDLDARATRMAAHLAAHGLQPGERAVVQLPNVPEFFDVLFGLLRLGARPILALPAHRQREIGFFCTHADAAAYLVADQHAGYDHRLLARDVQAQAPGLRRVFVLGETAEFTPLQPAAGTPPFSPPAGNAAEVALYQLSGGSTGTPKLIPRTHDDYLYSIRASAAICALGPQTVYLAALPLAHNFPLTSPGTLGMFHAGGQVVLSPAPTPDVAFPLIRQHGVTHTALVPALLQVWLQAAEQAGGPGLSSLRCVQVGGAPLSPDTARQVPARLGAEVQQVFGMAEGLVNYVRPGTPLERAACTQGHPISPHDEVRVVDDEDRPVPDGTPGHLLTRGPYTIRGYFRAPEHNARAFTPDGFYRTGDLVTRWPDGALTVTGRHKDQINRAGEKIAAEEIEHALLLHPQVRGAALVGVPDPWLGERSCAFVQPASPTPPGLALTLRRHLQALGLAAYKIPDRIELLDELPRTAVGKLDKPALRARMAPRSTP